MRHQFTGQDTTFISPSAGFVAGRGRLRARGSVYRSFRAPTLNELFRTFRQGNAQTNANPLLKPETVFGSEVGFDLVGEAHAVHEKHGQIHVALNHRQQRRSRNVEVARRDAVFFHLFWKQVPPGNLEFFFFRISGQPDHFHAISQSRLDRVENVGGRHENDVRQIERDAQIVIAKTVVLLRVEDFQQSR